MTALHLQRVNISLSKLTSRCISSILWMEVLIVDCDLLSWFTDFHLRLWISISAWLLFRQSTFHFQNVSTVFLCAPPTHKVVLSFSNWSMISFPIIQRWNPVSKVTNKKALLSLWLVWECAHVCIFTMLNIALFQYWLQSLAVFKVYCDRRQCMSWTTSYLAGGPDF